MARSRRTMRRRTSRRRRADWVFRPNVHDESGNLVDNFGTYQPTFTTLTPGVDNAFIKILYDSHNRFSSLTQGPGNTQEPGLPRVSRAEGRKATILAVQGSITFDSSTWVGGDLVDFGFRIGAFEQDVMNGGVLIDATYSLFNPTTINMVKPAIWANDRNWDFERRYRTRFGGGTDPVWRFQINVRAKRRLNPNMCYAVFFESAAGNNLNVRPFLRTLVQDEG